MTKKSSTLTNFFLTDRTSGNQVLTQGEVLKSYGSRIHHLQRGQEIASAAYVEATVEIGRLLKEAKDYAASLKLSGKDKLWTEFKDSLGYSEPTMTKYIKVAEHPVLRLKTYRKKLPPSLHSLYELSKLDAPTLKNHISEGQVTSTLGRSQVAALLGKSPNKRQVISQGQVEVFVLTVSKQDWQSRLLTIEDTLKEFCTQHAIGMKHSKQASEFLKRQDRDADRYDKKIALHILKSAKQFCNEQARTMIDTSFKDRFGLQALKKLSFRAKYKKLNYGEDEIECNECTDVNEVKAIYLSYGMDGEGYWNEQYSKWLDDAMTTIPRPKSLEFEAEVPDVSLDEVAASLKRTKKKNFTGVKFKL